MSKVCFVDITTVRRKIRRLIRAEIACSWEGAGDPADIPFFRAELKKARKDLNNYLRPMGERL